MSIKILNKTDLRAHMTAVRADIKNRAESDKFIARNFLKILTESKRSEVFIYASINTEADTSFIIERIKNTHKIYVPHTDKTGMKLVCLPLNGLKRPDSRGNLYVGQTPRPVTAPFSGVTVTPLLGFNSNKFRLGYGGGHYDKFFAFQGKLSLKIGLAYDEQFVGFKPEKHDVPLDIIVTQTKIITGSI